VADLNNIDDIRNGVFVSGNVHLALDQHVAAILKTPNRILATADIPPRHQRTLRQNTEYPDNRYTLQWLDPEDDAEIVAPNNSDAAFKSDTELSKPSDLLLHYAYAAAAVKCWGHGTRVLEDRAKPPRPQPPRKVKTGTSRSTGDRKKTAQRRQDAQRAGNAKAEHSMQTLIFLGKHGGLKRATSQGIGGEHPAHGAVEGRCG